MLRTKNKMNTTKIKFSLKMGKIFALCVILILSFSVVGQVAADSGDEPPPVVKTSSSDAEKDPGLKRVNITASSSPTVISAPDAYGYTWDNAQPYVWTDISSGNSAGLEDVDDGYSGPIDLGFDFHFYEGIYDQVYISSNGFLTFEQGSKNAKNNKIPFVDEPNAMVAPFWDDLEIGRRNEGNVYYQGFSDRFIVSYDKVASRSTYTEIVTFQVVLFDTGNICFQYKELNGELASSTVGIEDRDGTIGLPYLYNATGLKNLEASNALCFIRPSDSYRAKAIPEYQGGFIGEINEYQVEVINTGSLGADAFDLGIQQTNPNWAIELFDQSGNLITKDSNGNGKVETPILEEGEKFVVVARITPPEDAEIGSFSIIDLIAISLGNSNKTHTAKIQTAVPASFVQSLTTRVRIDLRMITSEKTSVKTIFPLFTGSTLGVQHFSSHNYMVFWERNGQKFDPTIALFTDIEHAVSDDFGNLILPAVKTTSNSDATSSVLWVYDSNPVTSVTPDGRVALVWIRDLIDRSDPENTKINSNVYLIILDEADTRNVISGPINLTNNTNWDDVPGVPRYYTPHLSGTTDNRFFAVWTDERVDVQGRTISNIGLAAYNSSGTQLVSAQKYTHLNSTVANGLLYQDPTLYGLQDGRVFLAFTEERSLIDEYHAGFAVLEANGATHVFPQYILGVEGRYPIPRQLSSGSIVFAMTRTDQSKIAYSMISNSTYQQGSVTTLDVLDNLASDYISVTEDENGYAILTWLDTDLERTIYYSLIDSNGNIVTPSMPFYKAGTDNSIAISESGRGNAPYDPRVGIYLPIIVNH